METKEELLAKLRNAVSILSQLSNIQQRLNKVRSQYRKTSPNKKMGVLSILCIGFVAFISVNITLLVSADFKMLVILGCVSAVLIGLTFGFFKFINVVRNSDINSRNQVIIKNNENLKIQEQAILNELKPVQEAYQEYLSSWYPANYCSVDAAEFFYNTISNYRADTLKEAINLYEITLHQRRIESNQQESLKQQKLNNLLAVGSLVMQGAALGEMSRQNARQTFAAQEANKALNDIRTHLRGY